MSSLPKTAAPQVQDGEGKAAMGDGLVARLRERRKIKYMADCKCGSCQLVHVDDVYKAADEIERLQRERAILRDALNDLLNDCINFDGGKLTWAFQVKATRALAVTADASRP